MRLRVVIADDEPLARERLRLLLAPDPKIAIVAECRNGAEVVDTLEAGHIDVLFLDIQMPGKDGLEVVKQIGLPNMPLTIFVTAYNQYAVEAFELHALDYLVKPIARDRLTVSLSRARERLRLQEAFGARQEVLAALQTLRQSATQPIYLERFLAKNGSTGSVVNASEVEWIEAADYYVCLHAGGKRHLLRESIRTLEGKLNPRQFVRVHRSAIVNINHLREIHKDGRTEGWVLLSTGDRVRLSATGWQKLIAMSGIA